jgi:hypothetical protein
MKEQFEEVIEDRSYLFKRMYHPELQLTYHIHHKTAIKHIIFRMRKDSNEWKVLPQDQLPEYIYTIEVQLANAIEMNELGFVF